MELPENISPTDIYLINNKCGNENIYSISYQQMSTRKYLSYHQMWVANHDNNEEGTFTNWYTGQVGRPNLHEHTSCDTQFQPILTS